MKGNVVSLFSGAGGLDLGFELTGHFRTKFGVEVLKPAAETFSRNFKVAMYCDGDSLKGPAVFQGRIQDVDFKTLRDGVTDIMIGGPPCQDFSIVRGPAWDRRGAEVERGQLYLQFIQAAKVLRPAMLVFENVQGLANWKCGVALKAIVGDFAKAGWCPVFSDAVDAVNAGVPQRRRRLIIIAVRKDLFRKLNLASISHLFEQKVRRRNHLLAKYPLTPIEAFEGQPLPFLERKYQELMREYEDLLGHRQWSIMQDYLESNRIHPSSTEEIERAISQHEEILKELAWLGRAVGELQLEDGSGEIFKEAPSVVDRMRHIAPGLNCKQVKGTEWEVESRDISLIYRRLHPLRPSYTVVAYGGGGTWGYHYQRNRSKLTHRERARLQSFPDNFLFYGKSQAIRAQIGEAVPPLLAKRIAEACFEVLENA